MRDQSGNNNTMRASSQDNQCYENDRNSYSLGLAMSSATALHYGDDTPSTVPNPLKDRVPSSVGMCFNLRKRSFLGDNRDVREVGLSTYNSAFLSGLFADIAKANEAQDESRTTGAPSPCKKSRVSMTKSISRCEKSFANLHVAAAADIVENALPIFAAPVTALQRSVASTLARDDSLSYQLHCVSSASSNESDSSQAAAIGKIAFPHLPATVSNYSCALNNASLTRPTSGQLLPESETDSKESYGWFVTFDEDDQDSAPFTTASSAVPFSSTSTFCDLAFSAVTAPKRSSQHDSEVEWAKAADTVDDVLGDFF